MTRLSSSVICLLLAIVLMTAKVHPVAAEAPEKTPLASIVIDVGTGKVLSQERATERRYPASTTKLMTAYIALQAVRDGELALDSPVVMTRGAASAAPSKMGYEPGSVIRVDNALRMILVKSANDVAQALGETVAGGSIEDFVDLMNKTAARIGMKDTRFINANGLPGPGQHTTAKDLAILGRTIKKEFPEFDSYFRTEAISAGGQVMRNGNKLLGRFDGADGMKTGYICASGFNLVSSATRDDRTLVAVVLGANGTVERESLSAEILEKGFATDPTERMPPVDDLPVSSGEPLDTSDYICSQTARTARANDRAADQQEDDQVYGSPYLREIDRPLVTVEVGLGGAIAGKGVEAGVSIIESYGIPIPQPRPERNYDPARDTIAGVPARRSDGTEAGDETAGADPENAAAAAVTALRNEQPSGAVEALNGTPDDPITATEPDTAAPDGGAGNASGEGSAADASAAEPEGAGVSDLDRNVTLRLDAAEGTELLEDAALRGYAP